MTTLSRLRLMGAAALVRRGRHAAGRCPAPATVLARGDKARFRTEKPVLLCFSLRCGIERSRLLNRKQTCPASRPPLANS